MALLISIVIFLSMILFLPTPAAADGPFGAHADAYNNRIIFVFHEGAPVAFNSALSDRGDGGAETPYGYVKLRAANRPTDGLFSEEHIRLLNTDTAALQAAAPASGQHPRQTGVIGIEFGQKQWSAGLNYMQRKEIDYSYKYSILTGACYHFNDKVSGRFGYEHDDRTGKDALSGRGADVYLAALFYKIKESVDIGVGYKYLMLSSKDENALFMTLSLKSGIPF